MSRSNTNYRTTQSRLSEPAVIEGGWFMISNPDNCPDSEYDGWFTHAFTQSGTHLYFTVSATVSVEIGGCGAGRNGSSAPSTVGFNWGGIGGGASVFTYSVVKELKPGTYRVSVGSQPGGDTRLYLMDPFTSIISLNGGGIGENGYGDQMVDPSGHIGVNGCNGPGCLGTPPLGYGLTYSSPTGVSSDGSGNAGGVFKSIGAYTYRFCGGGYGGTYIYSGSGLTNYPDYGGGYGGRGLTAGRDAPSGYNGNAYPTNGGGYGCGGGGGGKSNTPFAEFLDGQGGKGSPGILVIRYSPTQSIA